MGGGGDVKRANAERVNRRYGKAREHESRIAKVEEEPSERNERVPSLQKELRKRRLAELATRDDLAGAREDRDEKQKMIERRVGERSPSPGRAIFLPGRSDVDARPTGTSALGPDYSRGPRSILSTGPARVAARSLRPVAGSITRARISPRRSVPSGSSWLLQVARRKAIDRLRRAKTRTRMQPDLAYLMALDAQEPPADHVIPDERLRLIFTACHPALDAKTRIALTLRTLCGLSTPEIARAFLDKEATMAQRLARAHGKIAKAGIPYAVPEPEAWPERLSSVLTVVYLIFNEGYSASAGEEPIRHSLCDEAIRLARALNALCPDDPEVTGLLALLLLNHARSPARLDAAGTAISLEDQDRSRWDQDRAGEGLP